MFDFQVLFGDVDTPMLYVRTDSDVFYHVVFLHSGNVYCNATVIEHPLDWAKIL